MKRIGIAASKIAKGNWALYNFYVVVISFLFSLLIFVMSGATVVFALIILSYIGNEIMPELEKSWSSVQNICMGSLTIIVVLFNLMAISINMKLPKDQS